MREEIRIIGDCLEGIGIPNGGIAVVDRDEKPNVFDVVWCDIALGGITGCLKQIIQTGDKPIVHTVYKDHDRDFAFCSPKIFGVVLKVMDYDRNVVWERPEPVEYAPVKHGRWIAANDGTHFCSECGCDASYTWDDIERFFINSADDVPDRISNFCPNCGAEMDLEET